MASYLIITVCYSHKDNLLMLYLYIGVFISGTITNKHLFKHTLDVVSLSFLIKLNALLGQTVQFFIVTFSILCVQCIFRIEDYILCDM